MVLEAPEIAAAPLLAACPRPPTRSTCRDYTNALLPVAPTGMDPTLSIQAPQGPSEGGYGNPRSNVLHCTVRPPPSCLHCCSTDANRLSSSTAASSSAWSEAADLAVGHGSGRQLHLFVQMLG